MKTQAYGDCVRCGGSVEEKRERLDYRYHGQLFIVEGVDVGVCNQCGEKYLTSETAKKVEQAVSGNQKTVKTVAIPVISMAA